MAAILDFRVPGIAYNHTFFPKLIHMNQMYISNVKHSTQLYI
jgi:hypothetical protein